MTKLGTITVRALTVSLLMGALVAGCGSKKREDGQTGSTTPGVLPSPVPTTPVIPVGGYRLVVASGNNQSGQVGQILMDGLAVMAVDVESRPIAGVEVAFVSSGDVMISNTTSVTNELGVAYTMVQLGTRSGAFQVTASAPSAVGGDVSFTGRALPGPASEALLAGGNTQRGVAGSPLPEPLAVVVRDSFRNPIADVAVSFEVMTGGGTLSAATVATDGQGRAETVLTLGTVAGPNTVVARVTGIATPISFDAVGVAGPAAALTAAAGDNQSGVAGSVLANDLVVLLADANRNPVAGQNVTFEVTVGGGTLSATTVATDATGRAATKLTLGRVAGVNNVVARFGNLTAVTFTAMGTAGAATQLVIVSGNEQTGVVGAPLANALVVRANDANGNPVTGFMVNFSVTAGGGTLAAANVATNAQGQAAAQLTLGTVAGPNAVRAAGTGIATPINFAALALAGPATQLTIVSGNNQSGIAGRPLAQPFVVAVADRFNNAIANADVAFAVTAGGGSLSATAVRTAATGRAQSLLTLGVQAGANTVRVTSGNLTPLTFTAMGTAAPATQIALTSGNNQTGVAGDALQPFVVTVRDANNNPVAGFMVGFAIATGTGRLSAATVATDAQGRASTVLTPSLGANTVTATAAGLTGSPVTFSATGQVGPATTIAIVSGNNQSGVAGSLLPQALTVGVTDKNGNAVSNVDVTFAVAAGGGVLSVTAVKTDAQGRAATRLTLGPAAGNNTVTATSTGLSGSPITFMASATASPATQISVMAGDNQTGVAGTALAQAFAVLVRDANNNPVAGFMVAFQVASGGGSVSAASVMTNAQGVATSLLTLGAVAGPNTVRVNATGLTGSPITFTATGVAGPASALTIQSGNNQSGQVGSLLAQPFVVKVADRNGNAVAGVSVTFAVTAGGGSLSAATVQSDAQGLASSRLTLGPAAGANTVTATATGLTPVSFTAMGMASAASQIALTSGNNQTGVAGAALAQPFVVTVRDAGNNPVQGFMVTFAVATGGGRLSASSVATNAQGQASTILTLGAQAGTNTVTCNATGLAGSPITFTATGNVGAASALTIVSGNNQSGPAGSALAQPFVVRVADAQNNPVSGFTVTFAVTAGGGTLSATSVATNAQGQASATLTLGAQAGTNTVRASGTGLTAVTFTATGQALPPSSVAKASGDNQSARIGKALASPLVVVVRNSNAQPVAGVSVTFAVAAGGGTLSATSATTNAQGQASVNYTVGTTLGLNTVTATVTGLTPASFSANATPLTYTDDVMALMTAKCVVCHGPGGVFAVRPFTTYEQIRDGLSLLGQPYVVPFNPTTSVFVQKTATGGSMAQYVTAAEARLISDWVNTGAVRGGAALPPALIELTSGNNQTGAVSAALAQPFVVTVKDSANAPVANVAITWTVTAGGGTLSASSPTDLMGRSMVTLTLGAAAGVNTVTANLAGVTGSPITFTANAVSSYSGAPLAGSSNPLDQAALIALRANSIEPSALCTDGEFIQRVTGDLVGRLPTEAEQTAFLASTSATKRAALVDTLLASTEFATFWATRHLAVWIEVNPTVTVDINGVSTTFNSDTALIAALQQDMPLSTLVTRLSTLQGDEGQAFFYSHNGRGNTDMADKLMLAFTGMTSECARCHDHPNTTPLDDPRWIQDDNYGIYAFFANSSSAATKINRNNQRFGNPVQPRFVADGYGNVPAANVTLADTQDVRRNRFAQLFTASNAFHRGTAHRIWSEIASPLLDPNQFIQAQLAAVQSPALLQALSDSFRAQGTSLKNFLRLAMGSRLYQLSSEGTNTNADAYQGRRKVRRFNAEVLEQGIHQVAGRAFTGQTIFGFNFGTPNRGSIYSRVNDVSMEQALIQMNSTVSIGGEITASNSSAATLAPMVDGGQITFAEAASRIVRQALQRDPTAAELTAIQTARTGAPNTRAALEDVAVAVCSTAEFIFRD